VKISSSSSLLLGHFLFFKDLHLILASRLLDLFLRFPNSFKSHLDLILNATPLELTHKSNKIRNESMIVVGFGMGTGTNLVSDLNLTMIRFDCTTFFLILFRIWSQFCPSALQLRPLCNLHLCLAHQAPLLQHLQFTYLGWMENQKTQAL